MAQLIRATVLLLAVLASGLSPAQTDETPTEYQVKAAFLFKFGGYVDWPVEVFPDADSPFVIGIMGAGAMADDLRAIVAGRSIDGRSVAVRTLYEGDSLAGVHVLFIGRAASAAVSSVLESIARQPVLIVTEMDDAPGSAINFVIVNNKVRFDITLASAESRNLKISARLLGVARTVINGSS